MSRKYKARAKKYQKMTKDGVVEHDAVTGKHKRVSKRAVDFNLHEAARGKRLKVDVQSRATPKKKKRKQQGKKQDARFERQSDVRLEHGADDHGKQHSDVHFEREPDNIRDIPREIPMQQHIPENRPTEPMSRSVSGTVQRNAKYYQRFAETPENGEIRHVTHDTRDNGIHNEKHTALNNEKSSNLHFAGEKQKSSDAVSQDKKLEKLRQKANKANERFEKAHNKLHDNRIGESPRATPRKSKGHSKLRFERGVSHVRASKTAVPATFVKNTVDGAARIGAAKLHFEAQKAERDNVGVEAVHRAEQTAEVGYKARKRTAQSAFRFVKDTPHRKTAHLEKKATNASIKYEYNKYKRSNPKSNIFSRYMQKRNIKRSYVKAARHAGRISPTANINVGQVVTTGSKKLTQKAIGIIRKNPIAASIIAITLLLVFLLSSLFTSCSNIAGGGLSAVIASSYLAEDSDIDNAELVYTEWETDLIMQINRIESAYPGYDEYRYQIDDIGHNPYELMAFLTAVYRDFHYNDVLEVLQQIFSEQYQLTVEDVIETRYYEDEDGELVPYEWRVLEVTLTSRPMLEIITPLMDTEQRMIYGFLMQTKGNRQYLASPFEFNWLNYVTDYYGYRVHPISGEKDYHMGIDIGVPVSTEIHAGHDGTVTFAGDSGGYGLVGVIEGANGLMSKYAHCDSLLVSVGQTVKTGDVIAMSGNTGNSTGPHLHLEVIKNGQYLNPLFFASTIDFGGSPIYGTLTAPMGDGSFAALFAEAERHLGKSYRWGASGPDSFDCSGFVYFVYNASGVANIGRTTAQGYYNMSTPVRPEEAQPGDLVFFHSTISSANTVTHLGIYLDNGLMVHAGSPVQITSITSEYWQNHLYAFGRLS